MSFPEPRPLGVPRAWARTSRPARRRSPTSSPPHAPHLLPGRRAAGATPAPRAVAGALEVPHGTTIVALMFAGGVVIAGDRRATSGQRDRPARHREGVRHRLATPRSASPARPASALRWCGCSPSSWSTTRRSRACRCRWTARPTSWPAWSGRTSARRMQGLRRRSRCSSATTSTPPTRRRPGRIVTYDATGGRYDELLGYHAVGLRLGVRQVGAEEAPRPDAPTCARAVRTAVEALYDAADDDTATGGPDLTRAHLPGGRRASPAPRARCAAPRRRSRRSCARSSPAAPRTPADDRAPCSPSAPDVQESAPVTMPFYSSVDQLLRDRSELARKGIARGRSVVVLTYTGGVLFVAENRSTALHKVSEIYDRIGFAAVGPLQRVREPAQRRHPDGRRARLLLRPPRRHRPDAGQRLRPGAGHLVRRAAEALRGGAVPGRGGRRHRSATSSTGSPTTARSPTSRSSWSWAAPPSRSARKLKDTYRTGLELGEAIGHRGGGACRPASTPAGNGGTGLARCSGCGALEVAVLDRTRPRRTFRRITGAVLRDLLPEAQPRRDAAARGELAGRRRRPGRRRAVNGDPALDLNRARGSQPGGMAVELNHTIVDTRDKWAGARFVSRRASACPSRARFGPFAVVELQQRGEPRLHGRRTGEITAQHYAFLISEAGVRRRRRPAAASVACRPAPIPGHRTPGFNTNDGGRGLYFESPEGHLLEVLTRPYGSGCRPTASRRSAEERPVPAGPVVLVAPVDRDPVRSATRNV